MKTSGKEPCRAKATPILFMKLDQNKVSSFYFVYLYFRSGYIGYILGIPVGLRHHSYKKNAEVRLIKKTIIPHIFNFFK